MINQILTPELFRNWLESKEDNSIVGISFNAKSCPINRYLSENTKLNIFAVYDVIIFKDGKKLIEQIETPSWAFKFIKELDNKNEPNEVTKERSLKVLSRI